MNNLRSRLENILRYKEHLLYCNIAISINKESTDADFPMAVDGDTLYYNENILKNVDDDILEALFQHEMLHVLLEHYKRIKSIPNYDIDQANIAADLAVNSLLSKTQQIQLDSYFGIILPSKYGLEERQSMEWYYNKLDKEKTKEIKNDIMDGQNGKGDSKKSDSSKGGEKSFKDIIHHFNNNETEEFNTDFKNKIINQYNQISKSIGTESPLFEEIINANKIKIKYDPIKILKNITNRNIGNIEKYKTYKRPNILFPMDNKRIRLKGKMKRGKYKMGVIIDTSASISQEILTQYVSVIYQLFSKNKKKLIIDILQNDVSMTKIDKNVTINQIKEYQIIGRGGTELSESFEYVKNHKYDLCLVLTDGLLSEKIEPLNIPTTILLEDKKYEDHLLKVLKDWKWKNGNIIYLNQEVNNYE